MSKKPTPKRAAKPSKNKSAADGPDLSAIRARINELDRSIVGFLNQRAALVVEVGKVKRATGQPVYAPHREAEVLDRIMGLHQGPLPARSLEAVYRELMSGSFTLQQPLRVGYLGPPGTYSHLAALRHFGSSVELEDLHDITGVFEEVMRGHVQYAIVPVENTIGGGVVETLDAFRDAIFHAGRTDVSVCAEVQLAVRHNFLCNGLPKRVTRIYSKPEALTQCKVWLARQFPKAELVAMPSTSKAAEFVAQQSLEAHKAGKEIDCAAIGSELAGTLTGLHVLFEGVEDHPGNVTRFLVLSRQRTPATGDDKTSVMFDLSDRPGSLVHVLEAFARQNINLTHIEKRPSGRKNWTYTFFVDAQGHREDPAVDAALSVAKMHCKDLSVLGSYPRSKRVL